MNLIILNDKIRRPNGDLTPTEYVNAEYKIEGGFLCISHDGAKPGERWLTKIPVDCVAQIIERLPTAS